MGHRSREMFYSPGDSADKGLKGDKYDSATGGVDLGTIIFYCGSGVFISFHRKKWVGSHKKKEADKI